jgi:hypothetical protein
MMMSIRPFALTALVLLTALVGCQSSDDSNSNLSASTIQGDAGNNANLADGTGFFIDGANDVEGGAPPPAPPDELDEVGTETKSHFRAVQIDPVLEATAGPKFVLPFDMDNDGLIDLVTGWNQSQPVQLHLQRRNENGKISFRAVNLGGTGPIALIGDLDVADFNGDGWLDVAVLVKETGVVGICPTPGEDEPFEVLDDSGMGEIQILLSPANLAGITNGDNWTAVRLTESQRPGRRDASVADARTYPEFNSYSGMAVGDFDGINGPDIAVAFNPAKCAFYGDDPAPINRIVLYTNPGGAGTANGDAWAGVELEHHLAAVSDIKAVRVDLDDDIDLVCTFPTAISHNVRWLRNPLNVTGPAGVLVGGNWESRPVGQMDTEANVVAIGDVDGDGFDDVFARSNVGQVVQWFRHPGVGDGEPVFPAQSATPTRLNFPWQVYTMAEYEVGRPAGLAIGDLTGDGFNDVAVAAGGVIYWYDGSLAASRYAPWGELFVMDDTKGNGTTDDPTDPDFKDDGSVIYGLNIVDLDGDGANDIVATFDRRTLSGLTSDTLIWFRNTILEDNGN